MSIRHNRERVFSYDSLFYRDNRVPKKKVDIVAHQLGAEMGVADGQILQGTENMGKFLTL